MLRRRRFSSLDYWRDRYRRGGDSGAGSTGRIAAFKADVVNRYVAEHAIRCVAEFGCGDGQQLTLGDYPRYVGLDVAAEAISAASRRFASDPTKAFHVVRPDRLADVARPYEPDLILSLDVTYHLTEDRVFAGYMRQLFSLGEHVVLYTTDYDEVFAPWSHIRHRHVTAWIERHISDWQLVDTIRNRYPSDSAEPESTSSADFFVYRRAA